MVDDSGSHDASVPEWPLENGASSSEFAAQATAHAAEVEKFLDQALIDDIQQTPLTTLEGVLESRREAEERSARLAARSKELLQEELEKDGHKKEVKALADAIADTAAEEAAKPAAPDMATHDANGRRIEKAADKADAMRRQLLRESKPYVANFSDFLPEAEANRKARELKEENELLRKCLVRETKADAFDSYIRKKTTF